MGGPGLCLALALVFGQAPTPDPGGNSGPTRWQTTYVNVQAPVPTAGKPVFGPGEAAQQDEDSWLAFLFGDLFPCLLGNDSSPFKFERPGPAQFVHYPYANHYNGYLWTGGTSATGDAQVPAPQKVDWLSIRGGVEDGNNFSNLNWVSFRLAVDSESRVGGTTNWNWYQKTFDCGCTADFVIGDVNLTYRLFQGDQFQVHVGAGCRILAEEDFARTGFNALLSADYFPVQPVVVSMLVDGGTLGSVGVIHARATLGAVWRGLEFFAGYDFLRIGMLDLDGPVGGVRFWF